MKNIYKKGRRKEYTIKDKYIKEGWTIAQRTAGSHSPFDIIAINKDKIIKLIQSKPDSMSENDKKKILKKNEWLNGLFEVKFVVE